jgi:hypothetical protein
MSAIRVGHNVIVDLNIPKRVTWSYQINTDTALVDHRRLARHVRKAVRKLKRSPGVPKELIGFAIRRLSRGVYL